jgi:hypothetical protein
MGTAGLEPATSRVRSVTAVRRPRAEMPASTNSWTGPTSMRHPLLIAPDYGCSQADLVLVPPATNVVQAQVVCPEGRRVGSRHNTCVIQRLQQAESLDFLHHEGP